MSSERKRTTTRRFNISIQQGQSMVFKARGHENRGEENNIYCCYIGMIPKEAVQQFEALFSIFPYSIETTQKSRSYNSFKENKCNK